MLCNLNIDMICRWNNGTYAAQVIEYSEEALALICSNAAVLLFTMEVEDKSRQFQLDAINCSLELVQDFNQAFPVEKPDDVSLFSYDGLLKAIRIRCGKQYVYAQAHGYLGLICFEAGS